mmetsp:Transcript_126561/g.352607  ORF Transcript_126561/g.352607 Transcript_126561/m.352607 type:complete len:228 (+) Transcript_126561:832-1515(+)
MRYSPLVRSSSARCSWCGWVVHGHQAPEARSSRAPSFRWPGRPRAAARAGRRRPGTRMRRPCASWRSRWRGSVAAQGAAPRTARAAGGSARACPRQAQGRPRTTSQSSMSTSAACRRPWHFWVQLRSGAQQFQRSRRPPPLAQLRGRPRSSHQSRSRCRWRPLWASACSGPMRCLDRSTSFWASEKLPPLQRWWPRRRLAWTAQSVRLLFESSSRAPRSLPSHCWRR